MNTIQHALVLNLHQPSGNLEHLHATNEWEAKEILWSLDRMPRACWQFDKTARVHLSMSGTLLETISNPSFQEKTYGIARLGDILWHLQNTRIFDILGTGYYHPVFPLIPQADWDEQMHRWQTLARHVFWRPYFGGFWPPEMGFCMEMIPYLVKKGYRYVIVDSKHVEPVDEMRWDELRYRPHIAEYDNHKIVVVVRDRDLSDAQESGMDCGWFTHEICERTKWCDFVPLVTTATDGDNGGWFRNTNESSNFWHHFYQEFCQQAQGENPQAQPTFIHDYLDKFGAHGRVKVTTGAWNTGWHNGIDFVQWTGSQMQKDALARIREASLAYHTALNSVQSTMLEDSIRVPLNEAHWHLLRAETSCNLYWGEAWVHKVHSDLDAVYEELKKLPQREIITSVPILPQESTHEKTCDLSDLS